MIRIIDIGSNSIRTMDVLDGAFSPKRLFTTRLAAGLDATGSLAEARMRASLAVLEACTREAREENGRVFAYATSAVRDARNRAEFLTRVQAACALRVDVLSGADEARYALAGSGAEGLVDIGGGSTQLVCEGFAQSWPIGCVRASELGSREAIERRCHALFRFPRLYLVDWAGVGGTITTLAALKLGLDAYDPDAVRTARLSLADAETLIAELQTMPDRAAHPLLKDRHDVILPGAILCAFVMRGLGLPSLRVCEADGMEGYYLVKILPNMRG